MTHAEVHARIKEAQLRISNIKQTLKPRMGPGDTEALRQRLESVAVTLEEVRIAAHTGDIA